MIENVRNHIDGIDLVVFDLDGTLVDSRLDISEAIHHGIRTVNGPPVSDDAVHELIGLPLVEMFETLLPDALTQRVEVAAEAYRQYYFDHCADHSSVYPGVIECLDYLGNIPLAIATTKMTFMAVQVVEKLDLADRFVLVQGSDGIPHKPDPTLLHQVLRKVGMEPGRTWMVGDTVYDIQAGKAAGMQTCAVTYGIGDPDELRRVKPDSVLDNLTDFRAVTLNDKKI
ncbi:MAG: HAD-IA family hydrolase [Deltaproteobacteria bacterium]|nr:HAD-IA family hydrolase [Deltaproteobacteria bacterium]